MKTVKNIIEEEFGQTIGQMDAKLFNQFFVAKISKIYANQKLDEAAEKAKVKIKKPIYDVRDPYEYEVDEDSILNLKDEL